VPPDETQRSERPAVSWRKSDPELRHDLERCVIAPVVIETWRGGLLTQHLTGGATYYDQFRPTMSRRMHPERGTGKLDEREMSRRPTETFAATPALADRHLERLSEIQSCKFTRS
jgi:hypothetical protein